MWHFVIHFTLLSSKDDPRRETVIQDMGFANIPIHGKIYKKIMLASLLVSIKGSLTTCFVLVNQIPTLVIRHVRLKPKCDLLGFSAENA